MHFDRGKHLTAVLVTVVVHALVLLLASRYGFGFLGRTDVRKADATIVFLSVLPPAPPEERPVARNEPPPPAMRPLPDSPRAPPDQRVPPRAPATMAAPPAPTAEEWAFAARYTPRNSKGYRYTWGQQVRSMMGTAVEGPDQGAVRFRVRIAPDGTLAALETLWSTSTVAERLARKAIEAMPPLPPTPTGQPLIFERTIAFSPFAVDGPPVYRDDCLPEPPRFSNAFAWDGRSPPLRAEPRRAAEPDPRELEDCLRQLPPDSIDGENAHDRRVMDQWGAGSRAR